MNYPQVIHKIVDNYEKYPQSFFTKIVDNSVDIVDNCQILSLYYIVWMPSKSSPISTTFPAPMVRIKSPSVQFWSRKSSISPKLGK